TQFGPTAQVYRRPQDLVTARVFSDPPLNTLQGTKAGQRVTLATGQEIPAHGAFAGVADGTYTIGFRAHHLSLDPVAGESIALPARVSVSEITGSESFVHLDVGPNRWVALTPGVRRLDPEAEITVWLEPGRLFLFDAGGRLAAADAVKSA
ncbi:TOBE domain-containing protein, partial [Nostoc sp. NIES-2111]